QEPRSFRPGHPFNERERIRLFGVDFGLPGGTRTEALSVDLTPRQVRINGNVNYSDTRVPVVNTNNEPLPDQHNANASRNVRFSFDVGIHQRILRLITRPFEGSRRPPGSQTPPGQPTPQNEPNRGVAPADSMRVPPGDDRRPQGSDFAPQMPHGDAPDSLVGTPDEFPRAGSPVDTTLAPPTTAARRGN